MKIRTDFVTNSSSSSFVAYAIDANKIPEYVEFIKNGGEDVSWGDFDLGNSLLSISDCGSWDDGNDDAVIGVEICDILRSETFADVPVKKVKEVVAKTINDRFGTDFTEKDLDYYEESWYNG